MDRDTYRDENKLIDASEDIKWLRAENERLRKALVADQKLADKLAAALNDFGEYDEESYRQSSCHHCYGWSSNCRCLNCGKQMDNDPEEEDKYELC